MTEAKKRAPAKASVPAATNGHKPKPGDADFDWSAEYPGEEVFVFKASDGTTVGLTKLGPNRRPKPGKLALLDEQGDGIKVLWYFLKLASSDTSREVQAELEEEDYAAMARQWAEFAGIELGE
ncbi:hypothetical protein [Mycobacterium sp. E1747]|uniref:hypothetical protein n=1 Tax=Mycobacterium sp. E1747 TaxID=1834128 RepID=UPI0007FBA19D|nr:hypothetical protein [Mycobacterium sp. E1747]OBH07933.1 hypothetical protein A5695_26965 [Mycobacterium sp. E1747]